MLRRLVRGGRYNMSKSNIEWTDKTWNPVTGCTKVSPGCVNCYAETMHKRLHGMGAKGYEHGFGTVMCHDDALDRPLHWRKPLRVFVNSMSDLFHPDVPFEFIAKVFMVAAMTQQHDYQILTKRTERMSEVCRAKPWFAKLVRSNKGHEFCCSYGVLPNVWLGTSCEDQKRLDERVPHLLRTPAAVRFLSLEPLLGPIPRLPLSGINWVIVGGESGPGRRPMEIEWLESIVEHCKAASVPVFVKQDNGHKPGMQGRIPDRLWLKEFPEEVLIVRATD